MNTVEDLHVHTRISKDSKEDPEKYIVKAIERGIEYLGFSDHIDLDPKDKDFGFYRYEDARQSYIELKEKYNNGLSLLFATEVTYQNNIEKSIQNNLQGRPYDYIIGSIHRLEGYTISSPRGIQFFNGKDETTAYSIYFEEVDRMINTGFFDIVGHFDVLKRYGNSIYGTFNANRFEAIIVPLMKKIVEKNLVIEINSSGFRHKLSEQYPANDILRMYRDCGGREITIGSDAHNASQFGVYMEETLKNALSIFDFNIVVFAQRKKIKLSRLSELLSKNKVGR